MNRKVELGSLKHMIEVKEVVSTTDDYGFQVENLETVLRTRAMIEFDKSYKLNKEIWSSDGIETVSTKIFTFRKPPSIEIHTRQKISHKGSDYQIYIVNDMDEEGRFVKVWANKVC